MFLATECTLSLDLAKSGLWDGDDYDFGSGGLAWASCLFQRLVFGKSIVGWMKSALLLPHGAARRRGDAELSSPPCWDSVTSTVIRGWKMGICDV